MDNEEIIEVNKHYWNEHADLWFGTSRCLYMTAKSYYVIERYPHI
jgi:hypothetical protein